jgi:glutamine synthetase
MDQLGSLTFHRGVMEKMLSKEVFANLISAIEGRGRINPLYSDAIANAMKNWAVDLGATHFCHWFHPLTGKAAEKHDAFLDIGAGGQVIERFSGKWLFKGEPDASSLPSGGLRKTASARGYSCWDFQCYPFLWQVNDVVTLCIPAIFFSWCGKALDLKIPLMRSEEKLGQAALRLLHFLGEDATQVYSTLGCEQEFFLLPKELWQIRPDLRMLGRTILGAPSAKGQEMEDHYFSSVPDSVLAFMRNVEQKAFALGLALKTRHSEVAEKSPQAIHHNLLLMQIMHYTALEHDLACLFHEKPFAGINGSGKHCNWSLSTDTDINLLDPILLESKPLLFLSFITAVISAVHLHAPLLRASIASAGNDHRLGGNEAPPAIISVYLGEGIEKLLEAIENQREHAYVVEVMKDLQIPTLPHILLDALDRNRTSPFVFTGNKFEFRSVGASAHPARAVTVLNAIVAESLERLLDQMLKEKNQGASLKECVLRTLQKELTRSKSIRYLGDNYLEDWRLEASSRALPNIERSAHSFLQFTEEKARSVFDGILSLEERRAQVEVMENVYAHTVACEAKLLLELVDTQILPACLEYQTQLAKNIHWMEVSMTGLSLQTKEVLLHLSESIEEMILRSKSLRDELVSALALTSRSQAYAFSDRVCPRMNALRSSVDALEKKVQDSLWPLPKYRELLFSL